MSLIKHIEKHLGRIYEGWQDQSDKSIQIALFKNQPQKGVSTYQSIGLSNYVFQLNSKKELRFEILFSLCESNESISVVEMLANISSYMIETKNPLKRGQLISLQENRFLGEKIIALYCCNPVFFEESYFEYSGMPQPVVFVWLMPVLEGEAKVIQTDGWQKFEDILENSNCDFWDMNRAECL